MRVCMDTYTYIVPVRDDHSYRILQTRINYYLNRASRGDDSQVYHLLSMCSVSWNFFRARYSWIIKLIFFF